MLAARGEAQFLGGFWAKPQNPAGEALRIKQFARVRSATGGFPVRVAGIFTVEVMPRGFKFLRVARLKGFGHAGSFAEARRSARRIRGQFFPCQILAPSYRSEEHTSEL